METRYATPDDMAHVINTCKRLPGKANGLPHTARQFARYAGHGGRILVTRNDAGALLAILLYHLHDKRDQISDPLEVVCDFCVVTGEPGTDWPEAAASLRSFLRTLITCAHATHASLRVNNTEAPFLCQIREIGFLAAERMPCGCCTAYRYAPTDEHHGAVLIERILHGHTGVLVEV